MTYDRPMVLVVSSPGDVHAEAVMKKLHEQGSPGRLLDLSLFPVEMSLTGRYSRDRAGGVAESRFEIRLHDGEVIDLADVGAVWWRRPQPYQISSEINDVTMRHFALSETDTAMTGIWQATRCLWVNHLVNDAAAGHKPWQLATAQAAGLAIPETLITNDPDDARSFWDAQAGNVVCKLFRQTHAAWRETRLVLATEVSLLENVRLAPVLFQEMVTGVADLRVTVVGNELFAAAAALEDVAYPVDIRFNQGVAYKPHTLPDDVEAAIFRLMQFLGLEYGAVDMRLTREGRYVFFEVNPSGQFLYVERSSGQPITAALVAHLVNGEPSQAIERRGVQRLDEVGP